MVAIDSFYTFNGFFTFPEVCIIAQEPPRDYYPSKPWTVKEVVSCCYSLFFSLNNHLLAQPQQNYL